MRKTGMFLGIVACAAVASACLDDSITGTRSLSAAVSVPATALVSDSLTATYTVTGTGLLGIILDWGDGVVDSLDLGGFAVEASGTIDHAYGVAGAYDIVLTAEDQTGSDSAQTSIQIN